MSTQEYIEEIKKLSIEDKVNIIKSVQDSINEEIGEPPINPVLLDILVKRQEELKSGVVSSRPWDEIKKDILNWKKSV